MRRTRMTGMRFLLTAAAVGGILAVGACEGSNLFTNPDNPVDVTEGDVIAPVVSISIPRGDSLSAQPVGDSVFVTARISDDVGIRSIRMFGIAQRGVDSLGTNTVVERFQEKTITLGGLVQDTTLY